MVDAQILVCYFPSFIILLKINLSSLGYITLSSGVNISGVTGSNARRDQTVMTNQSFKQGVVS